MDETDRQLSPEEVMDICKKANDNNESIEKLMIKTESKPVRYVQINAGKYKTLMNKEGTVLKPMPPY